MVEFHQGEPGSAAERALRLLELLQAAFQQALAHELPNRLVAVGGLAQLLLVEQGQRLDDEGRNYLGRLAQAVRQTDEMVRALADLGRLVRDPGPAVALDLGEIAREALAEVKVLFPRRVIEYDLGQSFPALTMPQRPWLQLFSLLCRYFVESTREDQPCRITIDGKDLGETVEIRAADQTPRSEEELKTVLEPFTASGMCSGKGLNLFPIRVIVAGWAGHFHSEPAQGTRFVVTVRTSDHRTGAS
jgi:signal transduction histidine kinase